MNILHVLLTELPMPVKKYGGTERVVWSLATAQQESGHNVRFMLKKNTGNLGGVHLFDASKTLTDQLNAPEIKSWADVIHFHSSFDGELDTAFVYTEHGNCGDSRTFPLNTIFLSKKHAQNNHAQCYVYNGLNWSDYGEPNLTIPNNYFHYLAKAEWNVKNIYGAVAIASLADVDMHIMGGRRLNLRRTKYFFPSPRLTFHGMAGGELKLNIIKNSQGLIFPVRWHEPFGLAVIESLYLGTPVFATPFGSLPEIISRDDIGFLSDSCAMLADAINRIDDFDRSACHQHAKVNFNHHVMAKNYQICYERVLAGEMLNTQMPHARADLRELLTIH